MSLFINHNMMATNVANNLNTHYGKLATSTQRLSSGLRINSAADDAAGLAIRELMRADIAALHQGARNANDAISMLQTADGALAVIDEKLIRMKELAEQAATGTYDSTQRLMINSEFQQMASEINRIANATDFNGIKILDGNYTELSNNITGVSSISPANNTNPNIRLVLDYKFDNDFSDSTGNYSNAIPTNYNVSFTNGQNNSGVHLTGEFSGIVGAGNNPSGGYLMLPSIDWSSFNNSFTISLWTYEESMKGQATNESILTYDGMSGINNRGIINIHRQYYSDRKKDEVIYTVGDYSITIGNNSNSYDTNQDKYVKEQINLRNNWTLHTIVLDNGVLSIYHNGELKAQTNDNININLDSYTITNPNNNAIGRHWWSDSFYPVNSSARLTGTFDDLQIYSGALSSDNVKELYEGNFVIPDPEPPIPEPKPSPSDSGIPDDVVKIHFGSGNDSAEDYYYINKSDATLKGLGLSNVSIETQQNAQEALVKIDDAIVKKDNIRAYYGAMQNRLENTITNITTQAENLQVSESRISDVDIATEMTEFVRQQILAQSAVAMLSQANSLPKMAMQIIGG